MNDSSLVAPVESTRQAWTGVALAESVEGLVWALQSEGWVDDLLAGAAFGLEVAVTVIDPFSALLANGLGWLMEHFEPLREMLDQLTGIPDVVASHAATWNNMAGELYAMAEELGSQLARDLPDWQGMAAAAYQNMMSFNVEGLGGLGAVCTAMATATEAAGNLVLFTREIVRDLIADLVARVIVWALEAAGIVTIPWVVAQVVAAVVKWAGRIMMFVTALVTSLTSLTQLLDG
jgi:uncharacterized protein YukE